jgi:hypothetical protein
MLAAAERDRRAARKDDGRRDNDTVPVACGEIMRKNR